MQPVRGVPSLPSPFSIPIIPITPRMPRRCTKKKPVIRDESEEEEEAAAAEAERKERENVRALALAEVDAAAGADDWRPTSIVGHEDHDVHGRLYLCRWKYPGCEPIDDELKMGDWCRKWKGLVEHYEKVPLTPPHPHHNPTLP